MSTVQSLKDSGLKATLPRRKILELFESSKVRHLSAEDVYKALLSEGLDVVHRPDGSMMVNLQGRFQNTSVIRRAADGSLRMDCGTDAEPLGHDAGGSRSKG